MESAFPKADQYTWSRLFVENLLVFGLYWGVSHLNWLFFQSGGILPMPIWPAAAIALTAGMIGGWRYAPGIALGSLFANAVSLGTTWSLSSGIAVLNTCGPILTGIIIRRFSTRFPPFSNLHDIALFLGWGCLCMPLITATGGIGNRILIAGLAPTEAPILFLKWFLGHSSGALLFSPVLLGWYNDRTPLNGREALRFTFSALGAIGVTILVFFATPAQSAFSHAGPFLLIAPLAWIAVRFQIRETMTLFSLIVFIILIAIVSEIGTPFGEKLAILPMGCFVFGFGLTMLILGGLMQERDKAHIIVQKKTAELDRYFTSTLDLLCIADLNGLFRRLNPEWERTLGYPMDELIGRPFLNLVHPDDVASTMDAISQLSGKEKVLNFTNRYRCKDGSYRWLEWRSFPEGELIFATARDITGHKVAQEAKQAALEALQESEEKFRTLFENITEGVALHELIDDAGGNPVDYRIIGVNPAYRNHTGLSPEAVIGKTAREVYGTSDPPYLDDFAKVARSRVPFRFETFFPPMRKYFMISVVSPKAGQFATVFEDITERRNREEELKQKNEELAQFIYTVSHDLKSPLVTIKSFTGFLNKDIEKGDSKAIGKDLGFIQNAADKMGVLLDELLELSRIGRKSNPMIEVPLDSIVTSTLELVAGRIHQRGVQVSFPKNTITLFGDQQRLLQLFQNLVDNATKFMGDQPTPLINIGFEQQGDTIVLFIQDNGIGIDPRFHHKLFHLFEKLDPATEGTGIGLAIIKRIVEVHKGRIWFRSDGVGKGTTFYFTLDQTRLTSKETSTS